MRQPMTANTGPSGYGAPVQQQPSTNLFPSGGPTGGPIAGPNTGSNNPWGKFLALNFV